MTQDRLYLIAYDLDTAGHPDLARVARCYAGMRRIDGAQRMAVRKMLGLLKRGGK